MTFNGRPHLTPKEKRVLAFIESYIDKHNIAPSVREVGGGKHTGATYKNLLSLRAKGYIEWQRGRNRTICIVEQPLREAFFRASLAYAQCPSQKGFDAMQETYMRMTDG